MSRGYLVFDGEDLRDLGVYISGSGVFNAPSRAYEEIIIPGRDGTLYGREKRMENVEVTYPAFVYADYKNNIAALRSLLLSRVGYRRLTDSYHPDEFRMACFRGPLDVEPTAILDAGSFELTFDCKPQRYLTSGEEYVFFESDGTIENPTEFDSRPLLVVWGTGTFGIGSASVTISEAAEYTYIDCDSMDCYKGTASKNHLVTMTTLDFPTLPPGETAITLGTGITKIRITPRWYRV